MRGSSEKSTNGGTSSDLFFFFDNKYTNDIFIDSGPIRTIKFSLQIIKNI